MSIFNFFNKSGPSGHDPILAGVRDDDIGAVKQHLANAREVNLKNERGMTPFPIAVYNGSK